MQKIKELLRGIDSCECGRAHNCPMDEVLIGNGVLQALDALCAPYQHIVLVSDDNTWRVCAEQVAEILGSRVQTNLILHAQGVLIPDECAIETVRNAATEQTDLYVGVGSGVINDLCKYVSFGLKLPYFIVATAPSMDGYASEGCALILGGMKVTLNARAPKAIIAEQSILQNAPMEMLQAGYGDIIGKFSCLNDWKLGVLLTGEYFCQRVYDIIFETAEQVQKLAEGIAARDGEAVSALMQALVTVGIALSYVGNSRPASGSEHHLSHYFEITGILNRQPYFPHGIDVGFSSVITAELRQRILNGQPRKRPFERDVYEREIRRIYGACAQGVMELQERVGGYRRDIPAVERFEKIRALLAQVPAPAQFEQMLERVGLRMSDFRAMYSRQKLEDGILYAKDLKDRYTVLNLYYEFFR